MKNGHNIAELDRLRGIAIVLTIITHIKPHYRTEFSFLPKSLLGAWSGVDLFFVVSGYVITLSLLRLLPELSQTTFFDRLGQARAALKVFYLKRFYRLAPLAVAALLLPLLLSETFNFSGVFSSPKGQIAEIAAIGTGIYNYALAAGSSGHHIVFWSLTVEEHFYLLLPLVFIAFTARSSRFVVCLAGIALVAFLIRPLDAVPEMSGRQQHAYVLFSSHRRFDAPLVGVVLALLRSARWGESFSIAPHAVKLLIVPLCVLAIWTLPALQPHPTIPEAHRVDLAFLAIALLSGMLVFLGSLQRGYIFEARGLRHVLEYLGTRSYSLYLTHLTGMRLRDEAVHRLQGGAWGTWLLETGIGKAVLVAAGLVVILGLAELGYRLVEQPWLRRGRKIIDPLLVQIHARHAAGNPAKNLVRNRLRPTG